MTSPMPAPWDNAPPPLPPAPPPPPKPKPPRDASKWPCVPPCALPPLPTGWWPVCTPWGNPGNPPPPYRAAARTACGLGWYAAARCDPGGPGNEGGIAMGPPKGRPRCMLAATRELRMAGSTEDHDGMATEPAEEVEGKAAEEGGMPGLKSWAVIRGRALA